MRRFTMAAACLILVVMSLAQSEPPASPQFFIAVLGNGRTPATLQNTDLMITLDGKPVSIDRLSRADKIPMSFAIVADVSRSQIDKQVFQRKAIKDIFRRLSAAGNRGILVLFNDRVSVSDHALSVNEVDQIVSKADFDGGTRIFDAVLETCKGTFLSGPRRVLILISDGEDDHSHAGPDAAMQCAVQRGISIFTLALMRGDRASRAGTVMEDFAKNTGGTATILFEPGKYDGLFTSIQNQYLIAIKPTTISLSPRASLHVVSLNKQVQVSAPLSVPFL